MKIVPVNHKVLQMNRAMKKMKMYISSTLNNIKNNIKNFKKENEPPKMKKRKVNETKELEQTLVQMSHRISNYMETKVSTADDAFMEFIKVQFNNIPEQDKNMRRKMIMDALITPLSEK